MTPALWLSLYNFLMSLYALLPLPLPASVQHAVIFTEEAPQFLSHDFRQRLGPDDPLRREMLPAGPEESVGLSAGKDECPVVLGTESDSGYEPASEIDGANDQIQLLPGNLYKILEGPFVIILKSFFTDDQGTIGGDLMESVAHGHELRGGI